MPGTAAGLGVTDAFNPEQNIDGGVRYLRQMLDRWDGDVRLALASYNWGPGAVTRSGVTDLTLSNQLSLIPNSTAGYIDRILRYVDELAS
jgi:soluble lytic murein transglycosylase-like protein